MTPDQANPENFSKADFKNFVTDALERGRKIGEIYHKLFTGDGDTKALVAEIEEKLESVKVEYQNLFSVDVTTQQSKVQTLNEHIRTIKAYHEELLMGDETTASIKKQIEEVRDDIEDSQTHITKFYNELFSSSEPEGGKKKQLNDAISVILNFHTDLTKADGYQKTTEDAYAQLIDLYDDLFTTQDPSTKQTKASRLQQEIVNINEFNEKLENEIKVFIKDTQSDIERKQEDIGRLLGSALGPALVQGYLDSKNEYRRIPEYIEIKNKDILTNDFWIGSVINLYKTVMSLLGLVVDYIFFVLPLLLSVLILTQQTGIIEQFGLPFNKELLINVTVLDRLLISLPLWWISLFGFKNIRDKNRLAEEYNHKAQVANMYNKFSSEETTYPIEPEIKIKLQEKLIDVIGRNPSEIYGRDETVFDKISKIFLAVRGIPDLPESAADTENETLTTASETKSPKPPTPAKPKTT